MDARRARGQEENKGLRFPLAHDIFSGRPSTRDWSIGSFLLPDKQQKALFNKIDDVRYDVRKAKGLIGAGVFALAGALAFVGISSVYRTRKGK